MSPARIEPHAARTFVLTAAALVAFAANSFLCRMALGRGTIGAADFSAVRLLSGAVTLWGIASARGDWRAPLRGTWSSGGLLFLYAVPFSFAYLSLSAGTGALVLFGSVQATMLTAALARGERPHSLQWVGLLLALAGLVVLVLPGASAPSLSGAACMTTAGIAWGLYSLRGRGAVDPLLETAGNFARAVPLAILVRVLLARGSPPSLQGTGLAVLSGAVASGVGYVLWYAALKGLSATRAALVQLPVPVLTAAAGSLFLAEDVTLRPILATLMILGGVALALVAREGGPAVAGAVAPREKLPDRTG